VAARLRPEQPAPRVRPQPVRGPELARPQREQGPALVSRPVPELELVSRQEPAPRPERMGLAGAPFAALKLPQPIDKVSRPIAGRPIGVVS